MLILTTNKKLTHVSHLLKENHNILFLTLTMLGKVGDRVVKCDIRCPLSVTCYLILTCEGCLEKMEQCFMISLDMLNLLNYNDNNPALLGIC